MFQDQEVEAAASLTTSAPLSSTDSGTLQPQEKGSSTREIPTGQETAALTLQGQGMLHFLNRNYPYMTLGEP